MKNNNNTPISLTIAGSDSGGGAGIQADIKAISANGVFATSVITAITAQNTCAVSDILELPTDLIQAQLEMIFNDFEVGSIKIGMLASPEIIQAIADFLKLKKSKIILDPVMISTSGHQLLQDVAIDNLIEQLFPLAELITPNLPEAARILDAPSAQNVDQMVEQAIALRDYGAKNVLLKGGHRLDAVCTDILLLEDGELVKIEAPRIQTKNTHGTGCTYSAAIAAHVAKGLGLKEAVQNAHYYLHQAIKSGADLKIGRGNGPVDHFYMQKAR